MMWTLTIIISLISIEKHFISYKSTNKSVYLHRYSAYTVFWNWFPVQYRWHWVHTWMEWQPDGFVPSTRCRARSCALPSYVPLFPGDHLLWKGDGEAEVIFRVEQRNFMGMYNAKLVWFAWCATGKLKKPWMYILKRVVSKIHWYGFCWICSIIATQKFVEQKIILIYMFLIR